MPTIPRQIIELARQHHRELLALERNQRASIIRRLDDARGRIREEIGRYSPERFRAQQLRVADLFAELASIETAGELEGTLEAIRQAGLERGTGHALAEIMEWGDYYGAEIRGLNLGALAALEQETLIERHARSLQRWGGVVAEKVRSEIATATITRNSMDPVIDIVDRSIDGERWQAERIVRTETIHAYNASHNATLREAQETGQVPDIKKSAIATFDARTDEDSIPVHGQVREIGENFVDGDGRRYLHPPGRPNDREKEIPWLDPEDVENITPLEEGIARANAERAEQGRRPITNRNDFESRRARLATSWTNGSHSKASIEMKRAALREFDLPGVSYERREYDINEDFVDQSSSDLRRIYNDTQRYYREQGITKVKLYRGIQSPIDDIGSLESWTDDLATAEKFGTYDVLEQEVDVRRIMWSKDSPGWIDGRFGDQREHVLLSDIPARRWKKGGFDAGAFDAREIDPDAEFSGPFGIVSSEAESGLYHVPSGRLLVGGPYSRRELRQISRELERNGHVDALGRLPDGESRDALALAVRQIRDEIPPTAFGPVSPGGARRAALEWAEEDFDLGVGLKASDFGSEPEVAGPWGIVRDEQNNGVLYHLRTGEVLVDGRFDRQELRRIAGELDQFLDDAGRLPGDSTAAFAEMQDEIASARKYYQRNVVDGYANAAAAGAKETRNLGGVEFPVINPDIERHGLDVFNDKGKGKWSRSVVAKTIEPDVDGNYRVVERKGWARGNFFCYKTKSSFQGAAVQYDDLDWHIAHLETGVDIHEGVAQSFGEGILPGGAKLGGWNFSQFQETAEQLETFFDSSGNVIESKRDDWLEFLSDLQQQTAPGERGADAMGLPISEMWRSPVLSETRIRLDERELELDQDDAEEWSEGGGDETNEIDDYDLPF